jgi:hypothetical protein
MINMMEVFKHPRLEVVIHTQEHIVASSVIRRHASEFIPGSVTFVGNPKSTR